MPYKNYATYRIYPTRSLLLLRLLLIAVFPGALIAQQPVPENSGMQKKENNFTSFTITPQRNIEAWKKANRPEDYDHPEFGMLPAGAPNDHCVEVLSKRTADRRFFVDVEDPSVIYEQTAMGNLSTQLNGDWVTIDQSLQPVSATVFESKFKFEPAGFNTSEGRAYIRTPQGPVYFNNWSLLTVANGVETNRGQADWSHFTAGDDGLYVTDIFPGVDAEMIVFRGAIKTNFILKENLFGTFDELIFRDRFEGMTDPSVQFSALGISGEGAGELDVLDGNSALLHVGEAALYAKGGPKELYELAAYRLDGNRMDIVVPFGWIDANIGNYTLVVDPLITGTATLAQAAITGSQRNGSCNFTNSCDYTLNVPTPANATITDVAWTFTYTANGTQCYLQDGAIRIGVGSCISPSTSGYYWFCNATGGGTCSGTNQTIFSDVSGCMPAPSCVSQNLPFTLKFYRSCWGPTGCDNSCIGAGSPWTMTITGKTLEYTNTATPITLSATTVCAGGSITASTSGTGGVPGYTYNWSFNSSGTPSVGSGASTSITFPTAGSVTLYSIVTDACGNQVTYSRVVTVTSGPTITVNSPTICSGGSATLTATGAASYTWSPATGLSATTGSSVTANPSATTTYTVTGTTSGCSGTATSTVTVGTNPAVTVNSATICAGASATLTATGAASYTWSPATGLSATTGASVTANPSATTTYTVTGTTGGCSGTATSTVTVNPAPAVTVNSATICAGASATLTATGAASYTWSPATGLSATTGASVTANPATTTTYTVTGTTSGCSGTATSTVTVNPNPTITVNSPTICSGGSATLTATGATSYTWSPATGLSATTGSSVTANPSATTTYTVTGTTSGCSGTATSTVTVGTNPAVTVNSATICAGASATLTATGAASYTWSPATGLSATTGASVTANPSATTTYTVTGTTGGCSGTATSTVTVNPAPAVTVNSATICAGASATLTATGAASYTWSPATGLSATTGASVTANPATTTTYTVTGTTSGCSGTATSTVTVNPNPAVTVNSETICAGSSATLTATGAASYTWSPATGLSATTGSSVTANPSATTTYTITGTTGSCTGTATSTVTVTTEPTITVNSETICAGDGATLTATGADTYTWSPATGLSATTGSSVTANPSATTTYTVTGTIGTCSGTATSTVTVNPVPAVSVNSESVCSGASATLTATGADTYTWSPATDLSAATGASVTASPSSTTTYTVTGTIGTCTGTATSTVTVNPNPTVTVNSETICGGSSATLTATGADTYTWSPATGLSATTGSSVTATPSATTTYTITGTTGSCTGTATSTVTVTTDPAITVNSETICAGDGATLSATGADTYTWSPATGLSATTGSSVTANPSVTTTYTVTGTIGTCTGTATSTVTVNPIPTVTAGNNGPLCPGDELDLTANGTSGGTYAWTGPSAFSSSAQNPVVTSVSASDGGVYTVQIALNGCTSTATTTVTINSGASTAITPAGPFCADDGIVTLTAASPGGTWSGDGIVNPATGAFDPSAALSGSNTVTYALAGGCGGSSSATITVNPLPVVTFSASTASGCAPLPVTFTDNSSPAGTIVSWDFGNGHSSTTPGSASTTFTADGCYDVTLTSTSNVGCTNSTTLNDIVCVLAEPNAAFSADHLTTTTSNPNFQFLNTSANAVNYQWTFDDGTSSAAQNPTHSYPGEPSGYEVTLVAYNAAGCSDTARLTITIDEELVFFIPNSFTPDGDEYNNTFQPVLTSGFDPYSYTLTIYNRWGETLFESRNAETGWDGSYAGSIAPEGAYTWTISFKDPESDKKYEYAGHFILIR